MIKRKSFSHLGSQKADSLTGQVLPSTRTWQAMGEVNAGPTGRRLTMPGSGQKLLHEAMLTDVRGTRAAILSSVSPGTAL